MIKYNEWFISAYPPICTWDTWFWIFSIWSIVPFWFCSIWCSNWFITVSVLCLSSSHIWCIARSSANSGGSLIAPFILLLSQFGCGTLIWILVASWQRDCSRERKIPVVVSISSTIATCTSSNTPDSFSNKLIFFVTKSCIVWILILSSVFSWVVPLLCKGACKYDNLFFISSYKAFISLLKERMCLYSKFLVIVTISFFIWVIASCNSYSHMFWKSSYIASFISFFTFKVPSKRWVSVFTHW